jgi:hypothetical protein
VTHYTIAAAWLKSWVLEGSVDGQRWTDIDRKTDTQNFRDLDNDAVASFAVSHIAECRFIRMTQSGKNHAGDYRLLLQSVEFFGTLFG